MTRAQKVLMVSLGLAALLTGLSPTVWGQAPRIPVVPFQNFTELTRVTGEVLCVDCTLADMRRVGAAGGSLYEFHSAYGNSVLRVDAVDDATRWASVTQGRRLTVRAADPVLRALTAEENLSRELEITGLLSSDRTLDVAEVRVVG
jgi:hypothetical protein